MKRVIQRKAKQYACDELSSVDDSLKKQKRASQDIGNKTRTSAAMLGLALSMGASGSILSCHSKGAMAAEATKVPVDVSSVEGSSGDLGEEVEAIMGINESEDGSKISHVIREGETLWTISNRYNVSSDALIHENDFDEDVVLRVGQKVSVPVDSSELESSKVVDQNLSGHVDQVAEGEVLTDNLAQLQVESAARSKKEVSGPSPKLSAKTVVPVQQRLEVKQAPALDEDSSLDGNAEPVVPGDVRSANQEEVNPIEADLPLQSHSASEVDVVESPAVESVVLAQQVAFSDLEVAEPSSDIDLTVTIPTTHQIQVGETLADIARRYNISTAQLAEANRIRNPNRIFAGRVLNLPPGSAMSSVVSDIDSSVVPHTLNLEPQLSDSAATHVASLPASSELEDSHLLDTSDLSVQDPAPSVDSRFYVDRLLGEIEKLSDDYRSVQSVSLEDDSVVSSTDEAVSPASDEVVAYVPSVVSDSQSLDVSDDIQTLPGALEENVSPVSPEDSQVVTKYGPELVAAAPLGAENYVPLNQPVTGRMVSPDLPPLTGPENYLPSGSSSFNGYKYPAQGTLTSGYGWRWGRMHRGIDIAAPIGTPIVAAAPGVIEYSGWNSGGYGNMVEVRHPDGSMTRYAHNSRNLVRVGQQVTQGEQIAEMGSTGYSTGPHVHFEIHLPDQGTVNPVAYLSQ